MHAEAATHTGGSLLCTFSPYQKLLIVLVGEKENQMAFIW